MTDKRIPLDPATAALPVKAIAIDGSLFAWDEATDPPWAGEWAFPPKGWDDTQRERWIGTHGHLIAVKREHDAAVAVGEVYAASPDFLIAQADAEVAETIRAKEIVERQVAGLRAWAEARKTHGANMRAISTVEGDVVIIVGMTAKEIDGANAAARMASELQLKNNPEARALALSDYQGTQRDWMLAKCVWPAKDRILVIAEAHPSLWIDLANERDDMARARADAEGKGFAP